MTDAPDHVVFCSYGNDSIALLAHLRTFPKLGIVHVVYSDTGWAHPAWGERLEKGEAFARECGFVPLRLPSIGLEALARERKGWPRQGMQFCTTVLKIEPAMAYLDRVDPEKEATCVVGVRREESPSRAQWPEFREESEAHGGRELWAPLVRMRHPERNRLILDAGFEVLPHRSLECFPCVNSNRADLRMLTPERVDEIEAIEQSMGLTSKGNPRTMFRPKSKGGAVGIREVKRWADSSHGKYEPPRGGCESGFCEISGGQLDLFG